LLMVFFMGKEVNTYANGYKEPQGNLKNHKGT
jgi:hypothetical protein